MMVLHGVHVDNNAEKISTCDVDSPTSSVVINFAKNLTALAVSNKNTMNLDNAALERKSFDIEEWL